MDSSLTTLEAQRTDIITGIPSKITATEELQQVSNVLARCRTFRKSVEERRMALVKPFNGRVNEINRQVKELLQPITYTENIANRAITEYQQREAQRITEEEAKNKAEAEATFDPTTSLVPEPIANLPTPAINKIKTDAGIVGFTTKPTWEIEDISKIPQDYFLLDTIRINREVKSGKKDIPGLRIYSIKIPTVRAK